MKALRVILSLYACLCVLGAFVLFQRLKGGAGITIAIYAVINVSILVIGLLFEKGRYRPTTTPQKEGWQLTGERFIDDSTGKMMEVRYDPKTGERDYIEAENK